VRGSYEGSGIGEADLRQVQDRPASRRGAGYLYESEAQATAGIGISDCRFQIADFRTLNPEV
jgi:hypothetical protein